MQAKIIGRTMVPLVLVLSILVGMLVASASTPVYAQNTACYRAQGGALWACGSGGTLQMQSGSTLSVQSGATTNFADLATFSGGLTVAGGNFTTAAFTTNAKQDAVTVTNGSTITPTGTYQPIQSAGAVGTSSIATKTAGTVLVLVNAVAQTITLTDTGTLMLTGNLALGQYDTVTLLSDGTNWIQLATSNN